MMCYKDQTFCPGPCANEECFRHPIHIDHEWLKVNSYMPVAWFLEMPQDCKDWVQPHESS